MNRGNIWITVGLILLLCLCHTLLTGIYPVRTLFPTINETIDRITDSRRNSRRRTIDRQTRISRVLFSHNGQLVATTRHYNWNEPNQIELRSFKDGSIVRTLEGFSNLGGFVFSPDDSLIAAGTNNEIYIWRTDNGQLLRKLSITPVYSFGPGIDFSTDGKKLVSVFKKEIVAWDVTSGQRLYSVDVHDKGVSVNPGGKFFAVGGRGSFIQLYNLDDGTLLRQLSLTGRPQFVSDDKILTVTTSGGSGFRVLLYQITTDTTSPPLFRWNANSAGHWVPSPDGRFLIGSKSGGGEGGGGFFIAAPRIPEPKVGAYVLWQIDGPYPLPVKKFFVRAKYTPRLFTPDSKFFLAGGDLLRLPLVHPWLANALLVVSVAMVIFNANRFPPIH